VHGHGLANLSLPEYHSVVIQWVPEEPLICEPDNTL
jgi:hypothetical protein